jgi:hypothetical protein
MSIDVTPILGMKVHLRRARTSPALQQPLSFVKALRRMPEAFDALAAATFEAGRRQSL